MSNIKEWPNKGQLTDKEIILFINQIIIKVNALGLGMNENIPERKDDIILHLKYLRTFYEKEND